MSTDRPLGNLSFYDEVSEFYDTMVSFENLVQKRKSFFEGIARGYKNALDIGCGSGADSIALSLAGLKVTGIDPSPGMISKAFLNALSFGVEIDFRTEDAVGLSALGTDKFGIATSMGNTFANIHHSELKNIFSAVYNLLEKNGIFIFQILNYSRIMDKSQLVIGTYENENYIIERKYIKDDELIFNITVTDKQTTGVRDFNTILYPHIYPVLMSLCLDTGFSRVYAYGNEKFGSFNESESKDLIIKATK